MKWEKEKKSLSDTFLLFVNATREKEKKIKIQMAWPKRQYIKKQ